jgi:dienelactone hydrolase
MIGFGALLFTVLAMTDSAASQAAVAKPRKHVATAFDGTSVHIYEYAPSNGRVQGLPVLMFHQAMGDARGELGPMAERLARQGRHLFTTDLRSGGSRFGGTNATAAAFTQDPGYCASYPDVLAATDYVFRTTGKKIVATGSSYSAGLLPQLATERPTSIAGFVSFSPASLDDCLPEPYLRALPVPGLLVRPAPELEYDHVRKQAEVWQALGIPAAIFPLASHGASILHPERAKGDVEPVWAALTRFIDSVAEDEPVEIGVGDWKLRGDFRAAPSAGAKPAVLLLNKANGDRRIYERLAGELAFRGISSLRLDMRGHGESINLARFVPFQPADNPLFQDEWRDIAAALDFLRSKAGVDGARLGVVGASYTGELMVDAARRTGTFTAAYAALSPGSFSEESARDAGASQARWLLARAQRERAPSVRAAAEHLQRHAPAGEVWVLDSAAHATDLLERVPDLPKRLAEWFSTALNSKDATATR